MIRILIVDDSRTEAQLLKLVFEKELDMQVIGIAHNGKEAVELTEKLKPTVITMDINMPVLDGLEATKLIMSRFPTPIIVISSALKNTQLDMTFNALDAGALSVLEKPGNIAADKFDNMYKNITNTIRTMSEIKVVKKRFISKKIAVDVKKLLFTNQKKSFELIAIGTSVGGPQALKTILTKLPADFPIPIVIVQHMTPGFINGFTKWLDDNSLIKVKNAEHQEILKPGTAYFAPDNQHLEITRVNGELIASLTSTPAVSGFRPSATVLLHSVSKICGKNALGVLLTGMGNDGAQGLLEIKNAKGHTIIQDKKSAVVFGMAGVAQELGAVDKIVELNNIADYFIEAIK